MVVSQYYCYDNLLNDLVSDELLLPPMKRVDEMITDNRKRLLHKLHIGQVLKVGVILGMIFTSKGFVTVKVRNLTMY